jgi:hypothetical protein
MKNIKIKLAEWLSNSDRYIDIPWPLVHTQAGVNNIKWLNKQDPVKVQMILEKSRKTGSRALWAEFYDTGLYEQYNKINIRCASKN